MSDTAANICTDVAVKFNDPGQTVYTEAVVLPFVGMAARELEQLLEMNDIPIVRQRSATIPVLANATELATYPADFVEPIKLEERASGSTDLFEDMDEKEWEPNAVPDTTLKYWVFRDGKIKFLGCTVDRDVRVYYHRTIAAITGAASIIEPTGSRAFLSARATQMVARDVAHAPTMIEDLEPEVVLTRDLLIRRLVKNKQGLGVRRRAYRGYGRRQLV